jgi:hypothetical protein
MRHDNPCAARRCNQTMSTSPSWSSRVLGSAALCGQRVRASRFGDAHKKLIHVNCRHTHRFMYAEPPHRAIKPFTLHMLNQALSGSQDMLQDMLHMHRLSAGGLSFPFHYPLAHTTVPSQLPHRSHGVCKPQVLHVRTWSNTLQIPLVPIAPAAATTPVLAALPKAVRRCTTLHYTAYHHIGM